MKNSRGWIEIVEAFTGIMLIAVILIIIVAGSNSEKQDFSLQIYDSEYALLRDIQLNLALRNEILVVSAIPVEWANFESAGLADVKSRIESTAPPYLDCQAKLCKFDDSCLIISPAAVKNIYVQSIIIAANANSYNPRKLNLFCWEK